MLGRSHALSGWVVGLAAAPVVGIHQLAPTAVFAACSAGYALLNDLDHPGSEASRYLGPVTESVCWVLRRLSAVAFRLTKTQRDAKSRGTHRHASHTLLFCLAMGMLTGMLTGRFGHWAVLGIVAFGLLLAIDALGHWFAFALLGACAWWWMAVGSLAALDAVDGWLGYAVALGCATHLAGDAATKSGVPIFAPVPICGQAWYPVGSPKFLRFRTGGGIEHGLVFPALLVAGILLVPGAWGLVAPLVSQVVAGQIVR